MGLCFGGKRMTYKSENQIWQDIITLLNRAVSSKKIDGFTVMRSFQPVDVYEQPTILIHRISSNRYGWRGRRNKVVNNQMRHIEVYHQELRFQIDVLKKIDVSNPNELTATDIANMLVDWLESDKGLKEMRSLGFMPLRIQAMPESTFVNQHDNYQINPHFDLICYIEQEIDDTQDVIDGYEFTLKGV